MIDGGSDMEVTIFEFEVEDLNEAAVTAANDPISERDTERGVIEALVVGGDLFRHGVKIRVKAKQV